MLVAHSCGHIIDVPSRNALFIKRMFCDECKRMARKLQQEQNELFRRVKK